MSIMYEVNLSLISTDSTVTFLPLFFREPVRTGEDWVVGHEASDTCVALPGEAIIAIRELQNGHSVAEARAAVQQQSGEDLDMVDFVTQLGQLGLVSAIDGQPTVEVQAIGQRWLARIKPEWLRWLCSWPMLLFVGLLILVGPLMLLLDSGVRPRPTDVFWTPSYTVDFWTLAVVSWSLVLKHELGHLLTARAKGLMGKLTVGRRLFYFVYVSRIAGIWKLPRRDRLLIYSAGMISDCATSGLLALLLVLADAHVIPLASWLHPLFRLLLIWEYIGVAWEFQIFMKTDVYHIVVDLTDLHDLPERGRAWLSSLLRRILTLLHLSVGRDVNDDQGMSLHTATDWITSGFSLIQLVGVTCSFIYLFFYLIPAYITGIQGEFVMLAKGVPHGDVLAIVDAVIALTLQAFIIGFLIRSVAKQYFTRFHVRRRWQQQTYSVDEASEVGTMAGGSSS